MTARWGIGAGLGECGRSGYGMVLKEGELDGLGNGAVGTGVEVAGGGATLGKANENGCC